ncbi:molybdenum cofactor guanylyltransferase MobA [Vibrio sp. 10N.261.55.A7]|uniref:molybdenum cofactor guanylyltransferase MobA n=1 Tax=Vibrio sp. 10N.261.55.A7 TaxID=1880851 RepID=UPI000C822DCD|nr:molybdenum cofactor guanylyltransferase MobA [Vibrio sp. 10N.261.55.A7]PMJ92111.1 molybdenum cofactor guanylyltransferase MobA [Vibrio sp. 10N.261.55.A7]
MLKPTQTSWVILAGGQATRMGGQDKGLIALNDKPLIQHVFDRLLPQTKNITINANRNLSVYEQIAPVVSDQFEGYPGPLGGIHSGLLNATSDWVGFVPCDSPMINNDLVERFCMSITEDVDILVAHDGEYKQPVFTMFNKRVLNKLDAFLERGDRKIILLYKECRTEYIDFSDSPDCFLNLNTPEELKQFGVLTS